MCYCNIAEVQAHQEKFGESIENYLEARKYLTKDYLLINDFYLGIGRSYLKENFKTLALTYLDSGLTEAIRTKQKRLEQVAYNYYKDYYLSKNELALAYEYLDKEYELDIDIRGEEVQGQIEVLNLKYEDEKKSRELVALQAEKDRAAFRFNVILISAISIAFLLALLAYSLRLRVKNGKLKEKELHAELIQKRKELTSYALNFIQKNELMGDLTQKINDLRKQSNTDTALGLNKINNMITDSFRIDQDWENFKLMFEEVHPDFFVILKERYPDLGNAELKLSALLRLNMNLKESSRVLGISPDSVKTARYRLRKKLNLEHDENLVDFFIKFDAMVEA